MYDITVKVEKEDLNTKSSYNYKKNHAQINKKVQRQFYREFEKAYNSIYNMSSNTSFATYRQLVKRSNGDSYRWEAGFNPLPYLKYKTSDGDDLVAAFTATDIETEEEAIIERLKVNLILINDTPSSKYKHDHNKETRKVKNEFIRHYEDARIKYKRSYERTIPNKELDYDLLKLTSQVGDAITWRFEPVNNTNPIVLIYETTDNDMFVVKYSLKISSGYEEDY